MAKRKKKTAKKAIESYDHKDKKRPNNPPVGLVSPDTDQDAGKKTYTYDPNLDPQLVWAGKAEHTSFEVPTVSLHVHERIDPKTIIEATRKGNGEVAPQLSLFESPEENPPLRQAVEFYKHPHGWTNRLIAGDSLLVMNSLLEKEGMAGKVQTVYVDPPYGIKYGSNFQPFTDKRDVRDGRDDDLSHEPEMLRAFRDTWELEIHSYLTYLRDRLLLSRDLLHESGSVFVQISDENLHHVRELMDEVFGPKNLVALIAFKKTTSASTDRLASIYDLLVWYARDKSRLKYRQLYLEKDIGQAGASQYTWVEFPDGTRKNLGSAAEVGRAPAGSRVFVHGDLKSQRPAQGADVREFEHEGQIFTPGKGTFKTDTPGLRRLQWARRLLVVGNTLRYVRFLDDFPVYPLTNLWDDTVISGFAEKKVYAVQTSPRVVARCVLMTTDPGDIVFDPTCGSGTTAAVAEEWGRRWVTCDTSRVAITLAKQRLATSAFDYYELAHADEGVRSGFRYRTVPHITLRSIANNTELRERMSHAEIDDAIQRHAPQETLFDQPHVDKSKARVTGPFTVEAVPAPAVRSLGDAEAVQERPPEVSVSRSGSTLRHGEWSDELLKCGVRAKGGKHLHFSRVETLPGCRWLHVDCETKDGERQRVVVSFGPEHAPLEQRQVELALEEANKLKPKPAIVAFASFHFDPEAAKDIDETNWPGVTLLKIQMNTDLLTEDLKKKRASNESFWMIGQPDVELRRIAKGEHRGKWQVEVHGFDYFNPRTGAVESGDTKKVAMWMLDTDYDGRSLYPRQVFFPMAGAKDGWDRLARNLKAEIDEDLIEAYRGTVSLPFEAGEYERVAVKIVDDRGIESLRILGIE